MNPARRTFLKSLADSAALLACAPAASGIVGVKRKQIPQPIIDTHQHIWNLQTFRLPWIKPDDTLLHRDYLAMDYVSAIEGLNVKHAVYMEVAVDPAQCLDEAKTALAMCQHGAALTTAAVIAGSPASEGFRDYIMRFKDEPRIKGVREPYVKGAHADAHFIAGLRLLGELGMSFDLVADPSLLPEMPKVVAQCPHTRFILDHCGNADVHFYPDGTEPDAATRERRTAWEEGIAALANAPNVICKISGVLESSTRGEDVRKAAAMIIDRCIDRFGDERVIFASNWPVVLKGSLLLDWVVMLQEITTRRGAPFQQKLFHDNAKRFYRL